MIRFRRFWQPLVAAALICFTASAHAYEAGQQIGMGGLLCDEPEQIIRIAKRTDEKQMPLDLSIKEENKLHPNACVLAKGPEFYVRFEGLETLFTAHGHTFEVHKFTILGIRESVQVNGGFAVTRYHKLETPATAYGYTQQPSQGT